MITTTNSVHRLKMSNPDTSQSKSDAKSEKGFFYPCKTSSPHTKEELTETKPPKRKYLNCGLT